ncbi:MAG: condensation domain-containing protein [Chitinophagaceae bacterium]
MKQTSIQSCLLSSFSVHRDATAIITAERKWSYAEVLLQAVTITDLLQKKGLTAGKAIGVCMQQRLDYISPAIGIFLFRGIYVPLDPKLPDARLSFMMRSAEIDTVFIDQQLYRQRFEGRSVFNHIRFYFREDTPELKEVESGYVFPAWEASDPLYVFFTSGSTGMPKAILGKNSSLANFIQWEIKAFDVIASTRVSQFIHPSFDAWLRDVFVPLLSGGCICIPPGIENGIYETEIAQWIDRSGINLIHCVPSFFRFLNHPAITPNSYPGLKHVLLSGEQVAPLSLKNWFDVFGDRIALVNLYGTTETTMIKTFYKIKPADVRRPVIPAGQAIDAAGIVIIQENGNSCDPGSEGEVLIVSQDLSLGYLADPLLTAERFVEIQWQHSICPAYKTGDTGWVDEDGNLVIAGRKDRQVKLAGIRVELNEIENAAIGTQLLDDVAVTAKTEAGDVQICLYFTAARTVNTELLRARLADFLPDYMRPSFLLQLTTMPLLPNGKKDLNALPDPKETLAGVSVRAVTDTEKQIVACWAQALKLDEEKIGLQSNFFRLGGNSLQLLTLLSLILSKTNVRIPLDVFITKPTVADCVERINRDTGSDTDNFTAAPSANSYAVTRKQQRLFQRWQTNKKMIGLNMPVALEIKGDFDFDEMEGFFRNYIRSQEVFRTSFVQEEGTVRQVVHPEVDFNIDVVIAADINVMSCIKNCIKPFDLEKAPLIRVFIILMPDDRTFLVMDIHHIIIDAVSMKIFEDQLIQIYTNGKMEPPSLFYKDYAEWMAQPAQVESMLKQRVYWEREYNLQQQPLQLPYDAARPPVNTMEGAIYRFYSDSRLLSALDEVARLNAVTTFTVLLSCYYIVLHKLGNTGVIPVGIPASGRGHQKAADMLGLFVGELCLFIDIQPGMSVKELISVVHKKGVEAFSNQDFDYRDMLEMYPEFTVSPNRNAVFDTWFSYQVTDSSEIVLADNLSLVKMVNDNTVAMFDLLLRIYQTGDTLELRMEYYRHLFREETIASIADIYMSVLGIVANDIDLKIADITINDPAHRIAYQLPG